MMLLNRYMLREFAKPFLFSMVTFALLIQLGHLFDRMEVFMRNEVQVKIIVVYLMAMLPLWLVQALPICTLIAGVTAIGNMSRSGEILCLRSSGVSSKEILKPLFGIAIFLTICTFILGDTIMPRATFYGRTLYRTYVDKVTVQKPIWQDIIVLAKNKKRISAKRLDLVKNEMEMVTVEEYGDHFNLRQALTAQKAEWTDPQGWTFYDGVVRLFSKHGDEIIEEEQFISARLVLPEKPSDLVPLRVMPEELSVRQLKSYIARINGLGIPALREKVHYHLKFAFPFTHIMVLAIGVAIAFKTTPSGGGGGRKEFGRMKTLAIALAVALVYFLLITVGEALGESRKIPPWLSVWAANAIFAVVGFYLLRKIE